MHAINTSKAMKPAFIALSVFALLFHAPTGAAQAFRTYDAQLITDTNVLEVVPSGGPESRPAEQDSEGHWGTAVEGFKLSLRFATDTFVVGDPIVAYPHLRNVTNRSLEYVLGLDLQASPACDLTVRDSHGQQLAYKKRFGGIGGARTSHVQPFMQHRYWARLDDAVDMRKPGEYTVQTKATVVTLDGKGTTNIYSAPAVIRIFARDGSTNATLRITDPPKPTAPH